MATAEQVKSLIQSHVEGDQSHFFSIAMQVAASEARKGHKHVAHEIRAIIDAARKSNNAAQPISIDQPRGELSDLLYASHPSLRLNHMTLEPEIGSQLRRIIDEQKHSDEIRSHDLEPRRKILLMGPPGTGKTMAASALAGELGMTLFTVRLDGLISRYMGSTISKLRLIFDAIQDRRALFLFDEFDSIGSARSFDNDVGEIKRVLNSFLMYIEQDQSSSIIIAATNYPERLDTALFRRFDDLIRFQLPGKDAIVELVRNQLSGYLNDTQVALDQIAEAAEGLSYSEITKSIGDALKESIISKSDTLENDSVIKYIEARKKSI